MNATRGTAMTRTADQGSSRWWCVAAWSLSGLAVLALVPVGWLARLTPSADTPSVPARAAVVVAVVSSVSVGGMLACRRQRHPVGWLLVGVGVALAGSTLLELFVKYGVLVRPGSLPAARYLVGFVYSGTFVWLACAGFVLLLTPTGSLPSPRWRWWARVAAAAPVIAVLGMLVQPDPLAPEHLGNPLAVPALAGVLLAAGLVGIVVVFVALFVGAASLVWRFRRARGVERQQLRWVAVAAALAAVLLALALVAASMGRDVVVLVCGATCVALLPLATGAAIQRYRLYDLDRIISRTLAYGCITVLLAVGYTTIVLGLGLLFEQDSPVAVAAATLAVAAAFQPARRRVQHQVDRRFNRRRYDATIAIEGFGVRLRDEPNLDTVIQELVGLIEQTMQPASLSLSLHPRSPRPHASAAPRGSSADAWS